MTPGDLRDMVSIELDTSAAGDAQPLYETTLYAKVPCNIATISGDETWRGRQLEAHVSHVVTMHDFPGITPKCRLNVIGGYTAGQRLNVMYVRPKNFDGRIQYQEVYCRELADV